MFVNLTIALSVIFSLYCMFFGGVLRVRIIGNVWLILVVIAINERFF